MSIYLARMEVTNDFNNIRPIMEQVEDGWMEVDGSKFGQYGTLTVGGIYGQYNDAAVFQNQSYCVFELTDSEFARLETSYSGNKKIKASEFVAKAKSVDSTPFRESIPIPQYLSVKDINSWIHDYLPDIMPPITKKVYLEDTESIFGPFTWEKSNDDRYKFTPSSSEDDPFMIEVYMINEFIEPIYKFDASKHTADLFYGYERHLVLNDCLPKVHSKVDCIDSLELKGLVGRLISQYVDKKDAKGLRKAIIDLPTEVLTEGRRERILKLVENGEIANQTVDLIPSVLLNNKESLKVITEIVVENPDYVDKIFPFIRNHENYSKIVEKLEAERKNKEEELEAINKKLVEKQEIVEENKVCKSEDIEKLEAEKLSLTQMLAELTEKNNQLVEHVHLQEDFDKLKDQYSALTTLKEGIFSELKEKIKSAYSAPFDGAIAHLLMQEAANFEREQVEQKRVKMALSKDEVTQYSNIETPVQLRDFLVNELNIVGKRNISQNDVANLLLCLSQGFLTVLAGEPGTGKTSLINMIAEIMGLSNPMHCRYSEIAVEKGWTSKRDLIGYYNPLTKSFDASNKKLYTAFETLDAEYKQHIEDFPYMILLDEANLSPMEHYWADFMSLCDLDKKNRQLILGEEEIFEIPNTLRFVATINLDHTTEILSPRLIDRAWIVLLNASDIDLEDYEVSQLRDDYSLVSYEAFRKINDPAEWDSLVLDAPIVDKFNKIRILFKEVGVGLSPRVIGMIKRFCLAGKNFFDTSETSYISLDYAIAQKVLPMINGYGDSYGEFIGKLLLVCDKNSMPHCNEILNTIYKRGTVNMQYYQFFSR